MSKKVICILQNAWGTEKYLPITFQPNERNKSCKVIRKIISPDAKLWFSNTTPECSGNASGKIKIDWSHCLRLVTYINRQDFDLVLICGKQAAEAMYGFQILKPKLVIKHPAARDLSNIEIENYKRQIHEILIPNDRARE